MRKNRTLSHENLADYEALMEFYFKNSPDKPHYHFGVVSNYLNGSSQRLIFLCGIHRPASSLLVTNSGFNNFRGLFNLGLFLLLITTARMALENVMKYGIIMDPSSWIRFILHTPDKYFAFGLLICSNLFVITALLLERATVRGLLGNRLSLALTIWNLICVLAFPTGVILSVDFNPLFSAPVLLVYTTLFLKLFSYAATNRWCRQSQMKEMSQNLNKIAGLVSAKTVTDSCLLNQNKAKSELEDTSYVKQRNTITNVEGEEKEASNSSESSKQTNPEKEGEQFTQGNLLLHRTVSSPTMKSRSKSIPQFSEKFDITQLRCGRLSLCGSFGYKSLTETLEHEPYDPQLSLEKRPLKPLQYISYPDNLTLRNIYYFIFAPTLCYEINFPRTLTIRKTFLVKRLFEIIFIPQLCFCLVQQWILPILKNSVIPIQQAGFSQLVERCLKLAVPNHLIWILMFYALFHSFFNFLGELLHFGDRFFYGDWWNAETVPAFWSTWNIPVHRFARRQSTFHHT
ncbi:unnamed protein product [Calicophoron daubneyi]|uniref:O-acyltransferase n=1 Tax=Calicophoron daubneyi TaxID=300641 RepID=A0AAV2TT77_CALDB